MLLEDEIKLLNDLQYNTNILFNVYNSLESIEGDIEITKFLVDKTKKDDIMLHLAESSIDEAIKSLDTTIEKFKVDRKIYFPVGVN